MKIIAFCILAILVGVFFFSDAGVNGQANKLQPIHASGSSETNELELLLKKIRDCDETSIKDEERLKKSLREISIAFESLGPKAEPLLPHLTNMFLNGRSTGASLRGLLAIGGTNAGFAIVAGLTNKLERIRFNALLVLPYSEFDTNRAVSEKATQPLLELLGSKSQGERVGACVALGHLHANPSIVIPALLQVLQKESDIVVRVAALRAISDFKSEARSSLPILEQIAASDPDNRIKRTAERAISAVSEASDSKNDRRPRFRLFQNERIGTPIEKNPRLR